ncbi:MAG: ABC transporter ATP-binding protein [Candidatus Adiutricales bacterium]
MDSDSIKFSNGDTVIKVSNLKKRFGDFMAVDGLSFDVFKGEIFGFLGPNGAGKTTSINMICGISQPTDGKVSILAGESGDRKEGMTNIGLCPQENIHWPKLTCLEQLAFMGEMYGMERKSARSRSENLLEWVGLEEKSNVLADKLSGGMKRRLNICLALVHDPEILILDEPEAGLDPQSRVMIRDFIKSLAEEKTVILTTHNMDEADRLADRVAIIDHGKLLLLDTPHSLKKSIGEGDLIEIQLRAAGSDQFEKAVETLSKIYDQVALRGTTLTIKSRNLIELLPDITQKIERDGFKIDEITMRENTLEDVFISLTGRKLRE